MATALTSKTQIRLAPAWAPMGAAALAALAVAGCAPRPHASAAAGARFARLSPADAGVSALAATMDPAMRALALRHDPAAREPDLWGRPRAWADLDLRRIPNLGLSGAEGETARQVNALLPFAQLPIRPMRPFVLKADGEDRQRALNCLSQAVYYEAAREPEVGQEAIAQVVLNRLRHPAYPKTICGVVYQGSARATGCQFTFTCDGALRWAPEPALWRRAEAVAERALDGFVDRQVGSATHYHADYVSPYWAPTLVKMAQVGQHIFYRWTGPWGEPAAFTGHYAGGEANISPEVLGGVDPRTQAGLAAEPPPPPVDRKVTLALAGEVRTYDVAEAGAPDAGHAGVLTASRRRPTPEEIQRINQSLAAMDGAADARPAAASGP